MEQKQQFPAAGGAKGKQHEHATNDLVKGRIRSKTKSMCAVVSLILQSSEKQKLNETTLHYFNNTTITNEEKAAENMNAFFFYCACVNFTVQIKTAS